MTTSAVESNPLQSALAGATVVDCDTHYTEPPDLWTSRAPARFKDRVPHMQLANGASRWFIEGDKEFGTVGTTVIDAVGAKVYGKLSVETFEQVNRAAWDAKARLQMMDQLGIWAHIAYPNAAGFSSTKFMHTVEDPALRLACIQLYNDAIAEWQAQGEQRLFPQALLPVWDIDATLNEARRAVEELKLTGFTISDRPETLGLPAYDAPFWAPFWEYCHAQRVPLNFHIGGSSGIDAFQLPWSSYGFERKLAIAATMFYLSNAATLANFLLSDLFDRYPNLKLVSVESGIGWIPFVLEALEYQLDEMIPTECAHLQRRPKEYFRDHIYACFWFEDFGPRSMIAAIGADNILFETDFPHPTCLYPKAQ